MPALWVGSVVMTIDPLLTFFWVWALYAFHRAVNGERGYWWVTGLALGLGALSKYTMLLLVVSFALYLLLVDRSWLKTRGPYVALAVALACLSGVVYWNWAHDWISLKHTASIGAGRLVLGRQGLGRFGRSGAARRASYRRSCSDFSCGG